jgi:glycosyltransferase involved in cell wall biosynthesis
MPSFAAEITPVILTADEEANIGRTLERLRWARQVVVVDSGSSDRTVELAKRFPNVRVVERPFDDHASQWTFATGLATSEWVLTLDADYVVGDAFVAELAALDAEGIDAFEAPFVYAVRGHPLRASLYPPRAVLLRRGTYEFYLDGHTQRTRLHGRVARLRESLVHDDRKPFARFVMRQQRYMRQEAAKIRSGTPLGLSGSIRRLRIVAPFAVVLQTLFLKGLILDGWPGIVYTWERFLAECILSWELMRK